MAAAAPVLYQLFYPECPVGYYAVFFAVSFARYYFALYKCGRVSERMQQQPRQGYFVGHFYAFLFSSVANVVVVGIYDVLVCPAREDFCKYVVFQPVARVQKQKVVAFGFGYSLIEIMADVAGIGLGNYMHRDGAARLHFF